MHQVIQIHPEAPAKPALGQACNGCGVCCLAEPCPLGQIISRKRHGACAALLWSQEQGRYLCGAVAQPQRWFGSRWPARKLAARVMSAWARRWISAGRGCDSDAQVED
ncbi:MAG: hypothetical protein EPO01_06230 [Aquabacterium sp.]|jgi:hypothetical protein|nr:MAG: hypothetical protein EPO12_22540 [Aquabacterium sp.]TAL24029.1 MAG: hypothetical protein EPO01_06230 [Aquabacterium sp.]